MFLRDLRFSDLVSSEDWQGVQDSLAEALGVTLRTYSLDGKTITKTSRSNHFLEEILPKVKKSSSLCNKCLLDTRVDNLKFLNKQVNLKCPFDLDIFIIPIKAVGEVIIAYVVLGPVMLKVRKNIFDYSKEAKKAGIDLEKLSDALIEISLFSYSKVNALIRLVKSVFSHIARTGYHKRRLGEIRPEVVELDPLFSRYYEEKILNSLLNSCTLALDADSGSVMTLDRRTGMLHIKAAARLDDDIVNNTNIKVGDGIAGVAAATSKPIMLPQDKDTRGLSDRLKRGYIRSSMIIPFNKGDADNVYGVINLNIIRKDREFSKRDILLVKELVRMASTALIPLRQEA